MGTGKTPGPLAEQQFKLVAIYYAPQCFDLRFVVFIMLHIASDIFTVYMVIHSISWLYVTYLFPVFAHYVIVL